MPGKRSSEFAFGSFDTYAEFATQPSSAVDLTGDFQTAKRACHQKVLDDVRTTELAELRSYLADSASKTDPSAYCGWYATVARRKIDRYAKRHDSEEDIVKILLALKAPTTHREYTAVRRTINETIRGPPSPAFSEAPGTPSYRPSGSVQDTPSRATSPSSHAHNLSPSTQNRNFDSPSSSVGDILHLTTLTDSPANAYSRTPLGPAPSGVDWEQHIPSPPPLGSPLSHKGRDHRIRHVGRNFTIYKDPPARSPSPAPAPTGLLPALPIDTPVHDERMSSPPYQAADSPRWAPSSPLHSIWTDGGVRDPSLIQGGANTSRSMVLVGSSVQQARIQYPGVGDGSTLELKFWKIRDKPSHPIAITEPLLPSSPNVEGSGPVSSSTKRVEPPKFIYYLPGTATGGDLQLNDWQRPDQPPSSTATDEPHLPSFHQLEDSLSMSRSTTLVDAAGNPAKYDYPAAATGSPLQLRYWQRRDQSSTSSATDEHYPPSSPQFEDSASMSRSTTFDE